MRECRGPEERSAKVVSLLNSLDFFFIMINEKILRRKLFIDKFTVSFLFLSFLYSLRIVLDIFGQ